MADLLQTPAAAGILPPSPNQGLQTIAGILGIRQAQQNLETGQATQASAQAKATIDTQSANENQALARLLADPVGNGILDADGNVTKNAQPIIMRAAPTSGAEKYEKVVNAAKARVEFNGAVNNLRGSERQEILGAIAGPAADPNATLDTLKSGVNNLVESKKGTPVYDDYKTIADTALTSLDHVTQKQRQAGQIIPEGQEAWRSGALNLYRGTLGAGAVVGAGGIAAGQAGTMDNGATIQPGTVAPALQGGGFTPAGAPIPKVTPPMVMPGPNGQIVAVPAGGAGLPKLGGGASSSISQPRTAMQDAPPPNAPRAVQEAYQAATQQANGHVEAVRTADENYGNNKAIASAVRQLASNADTGPGTQTWNHVMGVLGTDKANNYQELGAFLDRQAATVRGQMGLPGTNAGAEDAKMIAGNTNYNAKVIKDKNDYTEALTEGLHQYRNGLDRIAGFSGQASPQAVNQFKSAWTQNFDPNVYRGELAFKRSAEEGNAFMASLSPKEAASLAAKRKALQALSNGQLP